LDFTAIGSKRQGREVPQSLRVEPGAKHPVWKTQSKIAIPVIWKEQVVLVVGAASSRDHLISRLEAAPTEGILW
jgi:hypothetical protein